MRRGLVLRREDAGAFERDVDAEFLPRKLRRILDRGDLELVGADIDRVALDLHLMREAAMHAVVAQQVGVGLDRAEIVDGHDVDVLAAGLIDGADDVAADAAKAIDGNSYSHEFPPFRSGASFAIYGERGNAFNATYLCKTFSAASAGLGGDAEMLVEIGDLAARAEAVHADEDAVETDETIPAEADAGFDGDLHLRIAEDLGLICGILLIEELEARHRDDLHAMAMAGEQRLGGERDLDFRAGGEDRHVRVVGGREDVGAAARQVLLRVLGAHRRQVLACERQRRWSLLTLQRDLPALGAFDRVGRAHDEMVRNGAKRRQMLDRLVGGTVFAEADRVMRHDEDRADAHQRGQPHRRSRIVGEAEERARIGDDAAMQRHAVQRRRHAKLADAVVDIAIAIAPAEIALVWLVLVLLEPVRSAEPPMVSGTTPLMTSSAISDDLRVATFGFSAESFAL
jgi:hypothetical protein